MLAKQLIKNRNLSFLHPDIINNTDSDDIEGLLKAIGYFRNFSIFKSMYTLAYKSKNLSLDNFKEIKEDIVRYRDTHDKDYYLDGFFLCMRKSKRVDETKLVEAFIVPFVEVSLKKSKSASFSNQLHKSLTNYYENERPINLAIFDGNKFVKVNGQNIVKTIIKFL